MRQFRTLAPLGVLSSRGAASRRASGAVAPLSRSNTSFLARRARPGDEGAVPSLLPDLVEEFAAPLGDLRLNRRLKTMVAALAADPGQSLPRALGDVAGVEGGYRFLRNPRVKPDALSAPHRDAAWTRAAEADGMILAIEDTTEVRFNGTATRDGLGSLINDGQGFYLHGALLVEMQATGQSVPLGVAAYETMVRAH